MKRILVWAAAAAVMSGCMDVFGPSDRFVSLAIAPRFSEAAAVFASNADRLEITIERDSSGTWVVAAEETVDIDPVTGEVDVAITVVAFKNPETFRVTLDAIRSSDGMVLFSGTSDVQVTASSTGGAATTVEIPVEYSGPSSASIEVTPADTAFNAGNSYTLVATVFDQAGEVIDVPVTFGLVDPANVVGVTVERLTGVVDVDASAPDGEVFLFARTADGRQDQARLIIGPLPAGVVITPGFDNVLQGMTRRLGASVVDQNGTPLTSSGIAWTSRNGDVATVDEAGLVTANGPGTALIVATGAGFSDSALINVPAGTDVVVSAMSGDRAFDAAAVGETVSLTITADMRVVGELLGSYNATLTWDPGLFEFVDVQGADVQAPTFNDANVGNGELRFAQADASGASGQVVVARILLRAIASGTSTPTLTITELSAALTFTNLLSNVTVIVGQIAVQ